MIIILFLDNRTKEFIWIGYKICIKILACKLKIHGGFNNSLGFTYAVSAPIKNYSIDKTLILLKIIICILIMQIYIKIEFFITDSNLLDLSSKNDRIIFNISNKLILIKVYIYEYSL